MKRRNFITGLAAAGAAVAAGLYRFTDLFVKHYPPTPYDDVLAQVMDREHAAILGRHVAVFELPLDAVVLRRQLRSSTLKSAAEGDIATGRLVEVAGWLVPQTVARISALAAKV